MVTKQEMEGRDKLGGWDSQIHTTIYKTDTIDKTRKTYCIAQGTLLIIL